MFWFHRRHIHKIKYLDDNYIWEFIESTCFFHSFILKYKTMEKGGLATISVQLQLRISMLDMMWRWKNKKNSNVVNSWCQQPTHLLWARLDKRHTSKKILWKGEQSWNYNHQHYSQKRLLPYKTVQKRNKKVSFGSATKEDYKFKQDTQCFPKSNHNLHVFIFVYFILSLHIKLIKTNFILVI